MRWTSAAAIVGAISDLKRICHHAELELMKRSSLVMLTPMALGLRLCDNVIVEKGTEKVSLIGSFNSIQIPNSFCPVAFLCRRWRLGCS